MTQQDETSRNDYAGNGSTTEFVYTFKILDRTHIQVTLIEDATQIETIQIIDTDYDVAGVLEDGGGTVTFLIDPPATGFSIILGREVPFNQESEFVEGTPFPAATIETDYDKLTQITQQLRMTQRSSLKPPLLPNFTDGTLKPDLSTEINAGDILQINSTVDGFVTNSASVIFEVDGLTPHQIIQLGNIADTTFISAADWNFMSLVDQGTSTTDDVVFNSVNGATNLSDIADLSTDEIDQLKNIDSNLIDNATWGHLASMDQDVDTSSSPEFAGLTVGGEAVGAAAVHLNQNLSSGSIEDGNLSIESATTFNVSAGSGIIVDYSTDVLDPDVTEVSWSAFLDVTLLNIGSGSFKSVAVDSSGLLVQTNDAFTELELRDLIPIGTLVHTPTDIVFVADSPRKAIGKFDVLTDLISAVGVLNVSGNVFSPNGVNLEVDKTLGSTFGLSINAGVSQKFANITTDSAEITTEMTPVFRDGSGGFTFGTPSTDVDPGFFDDGSGTLQALGANEATNHRLAWAPSSGFTLFLYGQIMYANLTAATDAGQDSFEIVKVSNQELNVRTILSARGAAADLSDTADAVFTQISTFGAAGGQTGSVQAASLQTAYEQSPNILLDPAIPVSIQVDTDTDQVVSYKDSSGTEKYSVDGLGNINTVGTDTVTGNPAQGSTPLRLSQDDSLNPIATVFEDKTQFDKHVEINNSDDDEIPLNVVGSASPNTFLFRVGDNASNDIFTVDKDGNVLINSVELDSGPGESVVAYQEFGVLDPINEVSFDMVDFDDPNIIGYRIECRNLKVSAMGNDPGTVSFRISLTPTLDGMVDPLDEFDGYVQDYLQIKTNEAFILTNLTEVGITPPGIYIGTNITIATVTDVFFVNTANGDFIINNIPEFSEDRMSVSTSGNLVINDNESLSKFDSYGYIVSDNDPNTAFRSITLRVDIQGSSPAPDGTGLTAGSIKVIGITKGGPPFT